MQNAELFLNFCIENKVFNPIEAEIFWQETWNSLLHSVANKVRITSQSSPVDRFCSLLISDIAGKRGHLKDLENPTSDIGYMDSMSSNSKHLGWFDKNYFYFIPDTIFTFVYRLSSEQGKPLSITQRTLWSTLVQKNIAIGENGKNLRKKQINGSRLYLLTIVRSKFDLYTDCSEKLQYPNLPNFRSFCVNPSMTVPVVPKKSNRYPKLT